MAITTPVYATREDVKTILDVKETARSNSQIDQKLEASARSIESQLRRKFYPWTGTRYLDWPTIQSPTPWRLWLGKHELVSITTLIAGGTTIASTDYFTRPDDGPPYTSIEIDLASSAAFAAGSTRQRAIAIAGVFGHSAEESAAGALAEALDASETGVDVTNSAIIGVGNIVKVDSERMLVTDKTMLDTGQNLTTTSLTAQANDVTVKVADGTTFYVGETILLDSERMLIVDIAGNSLTVKRAYDGSVLAVHTHTTTDIYALRTLTVVRGALGTTAATHSTAAAITKHVPPALVAELNQAEAVNMLLQGQSGWARTTGSGDNERESSGRGLRDIRCETVAAYARRARNRAV